MDSQRIIAIPSSVRAADDGDEVLFGVAGPGQRAVGALQAPHGQRVLRPGGPRRRARGRPWAPGRSRPTPPRWPPRGWRRRPSGRSRKCGRLGQQVPAGRRRAPRRPRRPPRRKGDAALLPPVAHDHGDVALGQVPRPDLDPDGDALELPVHAAPAEAGVGPVVEANPVARRAELGAEARRRPPRRRRRP